MTDAESQLRVPPRVRFEGSQRRFDLAEEFERLPGESIVREGHIQKTLYRHGPLTTAIFEFQKDASIDAHRVEGETVLHVLSGEMRVNAEEQDHTVGPGQMLVLDKGVDHDLRAMEPTRLLMTVVLTEGES